MERQCRNWLEELDRYVRETESPRHFWMWAGLFTLCAAMQRKIWLPFGLEALFPNMYLLLVAPPGKCRKGRPIGLAHKMLTKVEVPIAVDSSSKRTITKEMDELSRTQMFEYEGEIENHCSISIISKEMSSLLALDPKGIIELLTDLFDSHQVWQYKTSTQGNDYLYGVCINLFAATTPDWMGDNLPDSAIGGGWASRAIMVYGDQKEKRITLPPPPPRKVWNKLINDLAIIKELVGPFKWNLGAYQLFDDWYQNMDKRYNWVNDRRLFPFIERMHIHVLKIAMALHIAKSNELILMPEDITAALMLIEDVLDSCSTALGGHGRAPLGAEVHKVIEQIRLKGQLTLRQLIAMNYTNATFTDFKEIEETIRNMDGPIKVCTTGQGETVFKYEEKKDG